MNQFKYITLISQDELEGCSVIPCTDEENFACILIKNSKSKTIASNYSTDNLQIKLNRILIRDGKNYYFHIIKSNKMDSYSKQQFNIIYEYIFKKIICPVDDIELSSLVTSLEDLFKITPEKNNRELQIGIFGELLTIEYLYNAGYIKIVDKYHTNFYSKHDVEINEKIRMEIKATTSEKRIHHFKHNQIMRTDVDVLISSILLEEAKEGMTLRTLFDRVLSLFSNPDSIFALKKIMLRCGIDDENFGMSFSYNKAINDIRFYVAQDLPKIEQESFDGISNIEYDVDCSNCKNLSNDSLLSLLEN